MTAPRTGGPTVTEVLRARADRIRPFIPPGMDMERVLQAAWVQTKRTPKLLECTPESILLSVVRVMVWGLELGETAYLVPFKKQCTPVAAASGLAELVIASGVVKVVEAHCVFEKELDSFRMRRGLDPVLEHYPMWGSAEAKGKIVGAYALFWLRGGGSVWEWMPYDEIDAIRKENSKQWGHLEESPEWYCRKTAIRRGVKYLPKNRKLAQALQVVHEDAAGELAGVEEALAEEIVNGATLEDALAAPRQLTEGAAPDFTAQRPAAEPVRVSRAEEERARTVPAINFGEPPMAPERGPAPLPSTPPDDPYGASAPERAPAPAPVAVVPPPAPPAPAPAAPPELPLALSAPVAPAAPAPAAAKAPERSPAAPKPRERCGGCGAPQGEPHLPTCRLAAPAAKPAAAPAPAAAAPAGELPPLDPACPACGASMWDNRRNKRNPKAPDFKCKDGNCEGVYWPNETPALLLAVPKGRAAAAAAAPAAPSQGDFPAALADEDDDLPF